jgi:hypothetical protein
MPVAKRLWIAVVMLLVFWSPSAIAMDQPGLQESKGNPSSRSAVTQEHANTPHEPSPMRVAQWRQVPQANTCACPAIICSELQRLRRVTCPVPEDNQPIVSVVVAMALP